MQSTEKIIQPTRLQRPKSWGKSIPAAYVMSRMSMLGHTIITWYFLITMYFDGMIPTYLLYKDLGLLNNPLVIVITGGLSIYNMVVARMYFSSSIPQDLYEVGRIDSSSEFGLFFKIALPLSRPITAVMMLNWVFNRRCFRRKGCFLSFMRDSPRCLCAGDIRWACSRYFS